MERQKNLNSNNYFLKWRKKFKYSEYPILNLIIKLQLPRQNAELIKGCPLFFTVRSWWRFCRSKSWKSGRIPTPGYPEIFNWKYSTQYLQWQFKGVHSHWHQQWLLAQVSYYSLILGVCLSLQFWGQHFTLWPQISDGSLNNCFSLFNIFFVRMGILTSILFTCQHRNYILNF